MADAKIVLSAEDRTRAAFESVKGHLAGVNSMAQFAGVSLASLGAAATLGGLAAMVNRIASGVDAMNDLKDATGASIENISALENIALSTGGSFDTVSTSLIKFNMALGQTAKPGSDAERVIKAIGLNAKELRAMDPAQALQKTAVALNQFADDGEKARGIQELFGKSLKEVAPFLKDLAEKGQLVATVTTKQAEEAEKYRKELFKLTAAATDFERALAGPVISNMNQLIGAFRQAERAGGGFFDKIKAGFDALPAWVRFVPGVGVMAGLSGVFGKTIVKPEGSWEATTTDVPTKPLKLGPTKEEIDAANKALDRQAKLLAELAGLSGSFAESWNDLIVVFKAGKINLEQLEAAQAELLSKQPAFVKNQKDIEESSKALQERWKDEKKVIDDLYDSRQRVFEQAEKAAQSGRDMLDELRFEAQLIGKTNEERAVAIALRQLEKTGIDQTTLAYQKLRTEVEQQVRGNVMAQAGVDAAEKVKEEWLRTNQQIADSFVDNLMRGGKSVAQYLKDLFRTLVLRPLLQPIGNMMGGAVNGIMGGGSSMMGGAGSSMIGSGIGAMFGAGGLTGSLAAGAGWLTGATTFTGAMGAGASLIGTGTAAGAMSGLGMIAGALGPLAIGAVILSKIFGGKGGPKVESGYAPQGMTVVTDPNWDHLWSNGARGDPTGAQTISQGISASYEALAKQLGLVNSKLDVGVFYAMDPQGDSQTQLQVVSANYNRSQRTGGIENVARGEEALKAAIGEETIRVIFEALKASDLADQYKEWLNAVTGTAGVTEMQAVLDRISSANKERLELEATLFDLTATDLEKLNKVRAAERAAVDASNLALLEQIYVQQDLATAAAASTAAAQDQAAWMESYFASWTQTTSSAATDAQQSWNTAMDGVLSTFTDRWKSLLAGIRNGVDAIRDAWMQGAEPEAIMAAQAYFDDLVGRADGSIAIERYSGKMRRTGVARPVEQMQAGEMLPAAAQTLLAAAQAQELNFYELRTFQARVAQAMQDTLAPLNALKQQQTLQMLSIMPTFASGGMHAGGWAMVGEKGPELAFMPPARIYTASDTRRMAANDQGGAAVAHELSQLRSDNRAQAMALAQLNARMVRLLERWETDGMPETRVVA